MLQWKSNRHCIFWVRVCRHVCTAHAPYCHLSPARVYNIFPHYLINSMIFGGKKKVLNVTCMFWFSPQILSETFLILRTTERDVINYVHWPSCKVPMSVFRVSRNFSFLDMFSKVLKFHENPSRGSQAVLRARTDGHDEANSRFSQFCERA